MKQLETLKLLALFKAITFLVGFIFKKRLSYNSENKNVMELAITPDDKNTCFNTLKP